MPYKYILVFIMISCGCSSGGNTYYYKTHRTQTEEMLKYGQYEEALTADELNLSMPNDGSKAMRKVYLRNENFQNKYSQEIINAIRSANTKEDIASIADTTLKLKRLKVFKPDIYNNIEGELISTMTQGNKSGKFPFLLPDDGYLPYLSDPQNYEIIFMRTVTEVINRRGDRERLLAGISTYIYYNRDNPSSINYITDNALRMRFTPAECKKYLSEYIPNLEDKLERREKIKIHVITSNADELFKKAISRSINEKSYFMQAVSRSDTQTYKLTVTLSNLDTYETNSSRTERTPTGRLGASAISGIIMAAKDVAGRAYTFAYDVESTQIHANYELFLCLESPRIGQDCTSLNGSLIAEKNLCSNPRLIRRDGTISQTNNYLSDGASEKCSDEAQKNLDEEVYSSLANVVTDSLYEFPAISSQH